MAVKCLGIFLVFTLLGGVAGRELESYRIAAAVPAGLMLALSTVAFLLFERAGRRYLEQQQAQSAAPSPPEFPSELREDVEWRWLAERAKRLMPIDLRLETLGYAAWVSMVECLESDEQSANKRRYIAGLVVKVLEASEQRSVAWVQQEVCSVMQQEEVEIAALELEQQQEATNQ